MNRPRQRRYRYDFYRYPYDGLLYLVKKAVLRW